MTAEMRPGLRIAVTLLGLIFCGLAAQHFWMVHADPAPDGIAGLNRPAIQPIQSIPDSQFDLTDGESKVGYVKRVTYMVHLSTYHCEPSDSRISILDRFAALVLGHGQSVFSEGILAKSRFTCGFCSQRAFLVYDILKRNGFSAEVFGLNGHVVTRVNIDGVLYYTDPDYGVGPFAVADDVDLLRNTIQAAYVRAPWPNIDVISQIYLSEDNREYRQDIDEVEDEQRVVFTVSDNIAVFLFIAGCFLFICVWKPSGTIWRSARWHLRPN